MSNTSDFDLMGKIMEEKWLKAKSDMDFFAKDATPEEKSKADAEFEEVKKLVTQARTGLIEVSKKMGEYGS